MKTLIQFALCALFLSFSTTSVQAQINDSLPTAGVNVEMTPYDLKALFTDADLLTTPALQELNNTSQLLSQSLKIRPQVSTKIASKSKQNPVRVKLPLVLQHNGNCYQIGCAKANCSKCGLFWWDRNNDGQVQPRKELRCICKENQAQCALRGREIDCD